MKKLITPEIKEDLKNKRLLGRAEYCYYLGVGYNSAYAFLKSIGALRKIAGRTLADREVIDKYFDNHEED